MSSESAIFIHAWWRSGSTYIWSKLRENKSWRCYYEPLHEKIARLDSAALKRNPDVQLSKALRHPLSKSNYFAEYADLICSNSLKYSLDLAYERYLLLPGQADVRLRDYLDGLISSASDAANRAILCFCRSQMRSAWMKETFGGIHLAQIRNPKDQWASFKVNPYFSVNMIMIALKLRKAHPTTFVHIEAFERFAEQLAKKPMLPTELIASQFVSQRDCFDVFLVIWIASTLQTIGCCDFLLDIDQLATDSNYRNVTSRWFESQGYAVDFSDCSIPTNSTILHIGSPSLEQTAKDAARAIQSGAASLVVTKADVVDERLPSLSPLSQWILNLALGRG